MIRRMGSGVAFVLGLLVAPLPVTAQQAGKLPLVGVLDAGVRDDAARAGWWKVFREALQELGYVEGRSIAFETRWAEGRPERLAGLAAELVRLQVDVIVTASTSAARAAKGATRTIPIVMASGADDPVKAGFVQSLARPGGNVTGVTSLSTELTGKRLELLKELFPKVSRVAFLLPSSPGVFLREAEAPARSLGIELHGIPWQGLSQLDQALANARREGTGALLVVPIPPAFVERKRIADLALKHRLPTAVAGREYAEAGGLLSYAVSFPALFPRAASYVDKILKGAKPADLPVEQPTRFEPIINLKTAKALGLTVPQSMLQRADAIIE